MKRILVFTFLALFVLSACGAPAPAPTAQPPAATEAPAQPTATETPAPTPTPIPPTPTPQTEFSVLDYTDCFASGDNGSGEGWKRYIEGSALHVVFTQEVISPCEGQEFTDFTFEVDVTLADASTDGASYGVQFRSKRTGEQTFQFYEFDISKNKSANFTYGDTGTGDSKELTKAVDISKTLNKIGESNHLKIVAIGDIMAAYVNNTLVAQTQDATLSSGVVGFKVWDKDSAEQHIVFEKMKVSYIPESAVLYEDSEFVNGGCFGEYKTDTAQSSVENGQYILTVKSGSGGKHIPCKNEKVNHLTDFILEADVTLKGAGYPGLTFRADFDASSGYDYMISPKDAAMQLAYLPNSNLQGQKDLLGAESRSINKAGEVNHMKMVAIGDLISLYINGAPLKQTRDDNAASGGFGLYIEAARNAADVIFIFDNVKVTSLVLP
jgi:hypothetical protein